MRSKIITSILAAAAVVLLAACGTKATSTAAPAASASTCTPASMKTMSRGVLTVATDTPAYPPYFENNDPKNGQGFESAVAYAVAAKLGYSRSQVKWTIESFDSSYQPGPKHFDFDINEISITPQRAQAVDFSVPYYQAPQAVLALSKSKYASATSLAALRGASIGVQIGTTSLEAVTKYIDPTTSPRVYNTSNDVVNALNDKEVDAIVTDLPTAIYIQQVQVTDSKVVGQFPAPGGDTWGVLLTKGSPLTSCVDRALDELKSSGQLAQITARWMGGPSAPELR